MDKKDIRTILYAINTFPKAFFVWGILDQRPQRPIEMEERLREEFPYMLQFPFLNRNNFNQYCKRSLEAIVIKGYAEWEYSSFQREVPTWQLLDDTIQPIAGFLLTKCVEIGVNCESFLARRKNSSDKHNFDRIQILSDLYREGKREGFALAKMSADWDSTGKSRYMAKLAAAGLIEQMTFSSRENHFGYRWVSGKDPNEVSYDYPTVGKDKYRTATKRVARILSSANSAMGSSELTRVAGYVSKNYVKNAVRQLHKQGFVLRLSKGEHSICKLTDKGERLIKEIIEPLILALKGDERQVNRFKEIEPTEEHLVSAMEVYAKGLEN
jgi:predicted transcriptional regulator